MKRVGFWTIIIFGFIVSSHELHSQGSDVVDPETAREVAISYLLNTEENYSGKKSGEIDISLVETRTKGKSILYYVFGINPSKGFLIISANRNSTPVLCYIPEGSFTIDPLKRPPAFNDWLLAFENQIEYSVRNETKSAKSQDLWNSLTSKGAFDSETMELKFTSKWDQTANYNLYSPQTIVNGHPASGDYFGNRTPTGCVATAMGQIMYYYKWPSFGNGSKTYNDPSNPNTNSDCFLTDPSYGSFSFINNTEQINYSGMSDSPLSPNYDISLLIYNAAVSVSMDFAFCQSWTNTFYVPGALKTYFSYHPSVKYIKRDSINNDAAWNSLITGEIRKERPVQYRGQASDGSVGHSWICYGYKIISGEVQYLFNFGWGGFQDGYFSFPSGNFPISSLGYNQGAVINIFPPAQPDLSITSGSVNPSPIHTGVLSTVNFSIANEGQRNAPVSIAALYFSSDQILDKNDIPLTTVNIQSLSTGQTVNGSGNITVDIDMGGSYYILVEADTDHDVHESDESDNIRAIPVSVVISPAFPGEYRSRASGTWIDKDIWEINDGSAWISALTYPTHNSGRVTIRGGHNITFSALLSGVDEVNVMFGGKVTVNGVNMIIDEGPGDDFVVNGTLELTGNSAIITTDGKLVFNSGGTYIHNRDAGTIPVAAWEVDSNCEITGILHAAPVIPSATQPFGNFIWNCPGQNFDNIDLAGQLTNIAGNFNILSTGTDNWALELGVGAGGDLTVNGNFTQNSGLFAISGGSASRIMTVNNHFTLANGEFYLSLFNGTGTLNVNGNFSSSSSLFFTFFYAGTAILNIKGNLSNTSGKFSATTGSGEIHFIGSGTQVYSSGATISGTINYRVGDGSNLPLLQMGTGANPSLISGAGTFTLLNGATLGITSPAGIAATGTTGNIQTTGVRTYSSGANYIYSGIGAQNSGNGLPATVNNLTINNSTGPVTFTRDHQVTNNFSINTGSIANLGIFSHTAGSLTLGGFGQSGCSYGSSGSLAVFKNDTYFAVGGTGKVTTGPCANGLWIGNSSTDWNTAANWYNGTVPNSQINTNVTSGSTHQPVISGGQSASCNNLSINPGASLTIHPAGGLTVENAVTNNGILNLESSAGSEIFSLIMNSYSGTGTANAQLFVTGGGGPAFKWHYVAVPADGLPVTYFTSINAFNLLAYNDQRVETNISNGWSWWDGFGGSPGIPGGGGFTTLNYGRGYNFYHTADVTVNLNNLSSLGTVLGTNGIQSLQYSSGTPGSSLYGFNLLGNSLTCSLDWDLVTFTGQVSHTVYFTHNGSVATYISGAGGVNGGSNNIPPLQGFFVKANNSNASVDFSNAKAHSLQARYKKSGDESSAKAGIIYPKIKLELSGTGTSDETIVWVNDAATSGYDQEYDGYKLFSSEAASGQLYSAIDNRDYVINGISPPVDSTIIPLVVKITQSGSYTIIKKVFEELDNYNVYLIDNASGSYIVDFNRTGSYVFTSDAGIFTDRFVLKFFNITTSGKDVLIQNNDFRIYGTSGTINILPPDNYSGSEEGIVKVYDLYGRVVSQSDKIPIYNGNLVQLPFSGRQGIYIIEVTSGVLTFREKVLLRN